LFDAFGLGAPAEAGRCAKHRLHRFSTAHPSDLHDVFLSHHTAAPPLSQLCKAGIHFACRRIKQSLRLLLALLPWPLLLWPLLLWPLLLWRLPWPLLRLRLLPRLLRLRLLLCRLLPWCLRQWRDRCRQRWLCCLPLTHTKLAPRRPSGWRLG
jgi:hypothetical protein